MPTVTSLLVIGAGPYGLSVAGLARRRGIDTIVVGRPMSFWREHMPRGMFLRSGLDWHLDAHQVHTIEAFLEERDVAPVEVQPLPVGLFLDYAEWYQTAKQIDVRTELVANLVKLDDRFVAVLQDGERVLADAVVAAPGIANFTQRPEWASILLGDATIHTCDLVRFEELSGARVMIIGGRQSAYEWGALIGEHGAERVDIVHRHDVPRFQEVSWQFVNEYIEATERVPGWWRRLAKAEQDRITKRFWEVGRLTLEPWLPPRLKNERIQQWPGTEVETAKRSGERVTVELSNGGHLAVDKVVLATGYRVELDHVPYLAGARGSIKVKEGAPVLNEAFESSVPGLYLTGFLAVRDFGPFFGFVKGAPTAAKLIVDDLLNRT